MSRNDAAAKIAALKVERDAIWGNVTGGEVNGPKDNEVVTIHGVTGAQIVQVARINGQIASLSAQFGLEA